jgi:hypothetical protein
MAVIRWVEVLARKAVVDQKWSLSSRAVNMG